MLVVCIAMDVYDSYLFGPSIKKTIRLSSSIHPPSLSFFQPKKARPFDTYSLWMPINEKKLLGGDPQVSSSLVWWYVFGKQNKIYTIV